MEETQILNGLACAAITLSLNLLFQNNQSVDPEIKNILTLLPNLLLKICSKSNASQPSQHSHHSFIHASSSDVSSIEHSRTPPGSSNTYRENDRDKSVFIDSKTGIQYREVAPVSVRMENELTPKRKAYFNDSFQNHRRNLNNSRIDPGSPRIVVPHIVREVLNATPMRHEDFNRTTPVQIDHQSYLRRFIPEISYKSHFNDFSQRTDTRRRRSINDGNIPYVDMRPTIIKAKRQLNFDEANDNKSEEKKATLTRQPNIENDEEEE